MKYIIILLLLILIVFVIDRANFNARYYKNCYDRILINQQTIIDNMERLHPYYKKVYPHMVTK